MNKYGIDYWSIFVSLDVLEEKILSKKWFLDEMVVDIMVCGWHGYG